MAGRTTPCLTLAVRGGGQELQNFTRASDFSPRESEACGAGALAAAAPSLVGGVQRKKELF